MIPTPHQRVSPFRGDTTPRPSIVEGKRIWEEYQGPKFDPVGLDVTGSPLATSRTGSHRFLQEDEARRGEFPLR